MSADHGSATFARREGTSAQHGVSFQYQVAALLLARALARDAEARVGAEHAHAGVFDDVSVRMRPAPDRPPVLILLQLKHKHDKGGNAVPRVGGQALRGDTGSFAVRKYYKSYVTEVDVRPLGAEPNSAYYVLFTNAALPEAYLSPVEAGEVPRVVACLLHTGCGSGQPQLLTSLADHLDGEPRGPEFISRFLWLGSQSSDVELVELLRQELLQHLRRAPPDSEQRARALVRAVEEWYEDTGNVSYLTAEWSAWLSMQGDDPPLLRSLRFADAEVRRMTSMVASTPTGGVLFLKCDATDEEIRVTKMAQVASQRPLLLARLDGLADCSNATVALSMWERGWCRELALLVPPLPGVTRKASATAIREMETLAEHLLTVLETESCPARPDDASGRVLVLLAPPAKDKEKEHPLATWLRARLAPKLRWVESEDSLAFRLLARDSQEAVLRAPVAFQGRVCALADLRQEHVLHATLRGDTFARVLRAREPLRVGSALDPSLDNELYIPRRLQKMVAVKPEVFKAAGNDVFVVKDISKDKLECLVPADAHVQLLDRHEIRTRFVVCRKMSWKKFLEFCDQYPGRRCHNLKLVDGKFMWQQSGGTGTGENVILKYLDAEDEELENNVAFVKSCMGCTPYEEQLAVSGIRTVLLSGDPGAGKSATLARVARCLATNYPDQWVIHLSLADYTDTLSAAVDGDCAAVATEELLCRAAGLSLDATDANAALSAALLRDRLWETGGLRVVLDAFDEISPDYTDVVVAILKVLQNSCVTSLWISSRQLMEDRLEEELCVKSFSLKPLDVASQEKFWVKYWTGPLCSDLSEDQLSHKAKELLKYLGGRFRSHFRLNIPLHSTIMASIFGKAFLSGKFEESLRKKDILYVYERFVEMKFQIYCREKASIVANHLVIKNLLDTLHKDFIEKHQMCALFESGVFDTLHQKLKNDIWRKVENFIADIQKGLEKTGIIVGIYCGKPRFLHRTFAEYFAAKWVAENHSKNPELLEILMNKQFRFVKIVADHLMSKQYIIHQAVLNEDLDELIEILSRGDMDINDVDGGGRTALTLAIQKNTSNGFKMTRILLENDAKVHDDKEVSCAEKSEAWDNIKLLLQYGVTLSHSVIRNLRIQNILEEALSLNLITEEEWNIPDLKLNWNIFSKGRSILHIAVEIGKKASVEELILMGADPRSKDKESNTPLHYAVIGCQEDIIDFLLKNGSFVHPKNVKGETPLYLACSLGQYSVVRKFLKLGGANNSRSKDGSTLLHVSVDHPHIMDLLLQNEFNINAVNSRGDTVLHEAICKRNFELVTMLALRGANVNISNFQSLTPLLMAVSAGCEDMAKVLLDAGANISCRTSRGDTPLHVAVAKKKFCLVYDLMKNDADPRIENSKGETPLDLSRKLGLRDIEHLLSSHMNALSSQIPPDGSGENKNMSHDKEPLEKIRISAKKYYCNDDVDGGRYPNSQRTVLSANRTSPGTLPGKNPGTHLTTGKTRNFPTPAAKELLAAVKRRSLQDVKRLTAVASKNLNDWNALDANGDSPLHAAARQWTSEALSALASRAPPAVLEARNTSGDTAMHVAVTRRDYNLTLTLMTAGADICAVNANGENPLHVACRLAIYPQIRYVLPRAPPEAVQARNATGDTLLHVALALGEIKEERELADPPAGCLHAYFQICYDDKEVKCHWEVEGPDGQHSAQNRSSRPSSRAQLMKTVLAAAPSTVLRATNAQGDTPLHVAARGRVVDKEGRVGRSRWSANVISALLEHEFNVAAVNKQGDTALHLACRNASDVTTISALLNANGGQAALSTANIHGDTPLHDAARINRNPAAVQELVQRGANILHTNAQGDTPLDVAQRSSNHRVAHFLKEVLINRSVSASRRKAFDDWMEVSNALPAMSVRGGLPPRHPVASVADGIPLQPVVEEECFRTFAYQTGNVRDHFRRGDMPNWGGYSDSNSMQTMASRNGSYVSVDTIDYQNLMSEDFEGSGNRSFERSLYAQGNETLRKSRDPRLLTHSVPDVFHNQYQPPLPPPPWIPSSDTSGVPQTVPDVFTSHGNQNSEVSRSVGYGRRNQRNYEFYPANNM